MREAVLQQTMQREAVLLQTTLRVAMLRRTTLRAAMLRNLKRLRMQQWHPPPSALRKTWCTS